MRFIKNPEHGGVEAACTCERGDMHGHGHGGELFFFNNSFLQDSGRLDSNPLDPLDPYRGIRGRHA